MGDEKERTQEMQEQEKPVNSSEKELEEAVDRVYRRYGPDLSNFVRDVQRDIQKRAACAASGNQNRLFV
jgi:hypothetical protein